MMCNATDQFIRQHEQANVLQLALLSDQFPEVDMPFAIQQIVGKQKLKKKVPLFYACENFRYPTRLAIEQSSSQITAMYKKSITQPGNVMIDLTGGLGVDFVFLSQNYHTAHYVEKEETLCKIALHNFRALNLAGYHVHHQNAIDFLDSKLSADLIFIDPYRRDSLGRKMVSVSDCIPDISLVYPSMLELAPKVLIKLSPMLDIKKTISELKYVKEVHVVSVDNECKELLFLLSKDFQEEAQVHTINLHINSQNQSFDFKYSTEQAMPIKKAQTLGDYLYEPNASVLKAGAFKILQNYFTVEKLHPHSHVYTSSSVINAFPGKCYQILKVYGNDKKSMQNLQQQFPQASVMCRNYPLTPVEYRKRFKITEGTDYHLFATTAYDEKKINIVCRRVF